MNIYKIITISFCLVNLFLQGKNSFAQRQSGETLSHIIRRITTDTIDINLTKCETLVYYPYVYQGFDSIGNFKNGKDGFAIYLLPSKDTLIYKQRGYSDTGKKDEFFIKNHVWELDTCLNKPNVIYISYNEKKYLFLYSCEYMATSCVWRSWVSIIDITQVGNIKHYSVWCLGVPISYQDFNEDGIIDFLIFTEDDVSNEASITCYSILNEKLTIVQKNKKDAMIKLTKENSIQYEIVYDNWFKNFK